MRPPALALPLALALAACAGSDGGPPASDATFDSAFPTDTTSSDPDADETAADSSTADASPGDASSSDTGALDSGAADATTFDASVVDSGTYDAGAIDSASTDAGADATWSGTAHVHIYASNTCVVTTSPTSFDVPAGDTLQIAWHNHSVDYAVDVWMSYGGGYTDLATGATWNESYTHCAIQSTHLEYADVSIAGGPTSACTGVRVPIQCHAP